MAAREYKPYDTMSYDSILGSTRSNRLLKTSLQIELLKSKIVTQAAEKETLLIKNRKLDATNNAMRKDLAANMKEVQGIKIHIGSINIESDIQVRSLMKKITKIEDDIREEANPKKELQQAHAEVRHLINKRMELNDEIEMLTEKNETGNRIVQLLPQLIVERDGLKEEYKNICATFEHDKKSNTEDVEHLYAEKMVHHHRSKQDSSELNQLLPLVHSEHKKPKPTLLTLLLLFSFLTFILIILFPTYSFLAQVSSNDQEVPDSTPACSFMSNNSICCDRSSRRTDICYMRGDIRSDSQSNSLILVSGTTIENQKIKPYTRKWEASTMSTIDELTLRGVANESIINSCDIHHDVPAVFFSTGGYTGNVYHEFNDGLIPLYITSRRFNKKVVFVILEYHDWWISKYGNILSQLSDYPPIDFSQDKRTHCFPEAVVGLEIHDELTIDSSKLTNNETIGDFRALLDRSYKGRIEYIERVEEADVVHKQLSKKPKLVIVSRNGSRGIENEEGLVEMASGIGFCVEVLRPERTTELAKIYRSLNSSDVMIGVHGAAMTHLLFMRRGSVFVQIVPLGTDWAAETYYGEPARKMGLKYVGYKILPKESSLYGKYEKDDPVLVDPDRVNERGWEVTKRVYLDGQNVILDLERFRKRLVKAYDYIQSTSGSRKFLKKRR